MSLSPKEALIKRDENNVVQRICHHCFNCGIALGHMKDRKKTTFTRRNGRSKRKINTASSELENTNVDLADSLSLGWKVHRKRGSKGVNADIGEISTSDDDDGDGDGDDILNGGNVYDGDDEREDKIDEDEEEDEDEDSFNGMQILRSYEFRDNTHRIMSTRSVFICKTCDMRFPAFHDVLIHVNEYSDSSFATIDGENIMGIDFEDTIDDYDATSTIDEKDMGADSEATIEDIVVDNHKEEKKKEVEEEDLV